MSDELQATDIFNPNNTEWEDDRDEYGNYSQHLVYVGCLEDYADELGISADKAYELLGEYEEYSRDEIEYQADVKMERIRNNE